MEVSGLEEGLKLLVVLGGIGFNAEDDGVAF